MTNNEKAKEITSQLKFGTSLSPIVNDRIYDASIKMAEWKDKQKDRQIERVLELIRCVQNVFVKITSGDMVINEIISIMKGGEEWK